MAIDKEKSMLKPSKNNFGLYRANFSVFKDQNSGVYLFNWLKFLEIILLMTIGKEKKDPIAFEDQFLPNKGNFVLFKG